MEPEHLKKILKEHALWLRSDGKEGVRADFQEADLQKANLQKANLQKANLQGANLQGAYLQGADLQGADLQGADLQGANLRGADLRGANLQGAKLQGANLWDANLMLSIASQSQLNYAERHGAIVKLLQSDKKRAKSLASTQQVNTAEIERLKALLEEKSSDNDALAQQKMTIEALESENHDLAQKQEQYERLIIQEQKEIDQGIEKAIGALRNSISQTDSDIDVYKSRSASLSLWGRISYALTFIMAIGISYYFGFRHPINAENWAGQWLAIATPLLIFFSIGTALLRHDGKVMQQYEHLSRKKNDLEKAVGVLEASKFLSQSDAVIEKHPMIVETFNRIRDSLLNQDQASKGSHSDSGSDQEKAIISELTKALAKKGLDQ